MIDCLVTFDCKRSYSEFCRHSPIVCAMGETSIWKDYFSEKLFMRLHQNVINLPLLLETSLLIFRAISESLFRWISRRGCLQIHPAIRFHREGADHPIQMSPKTPGTHRTLPVVVRHRHPWNSLQKPEAQSYMKINALKAFVHPHSSRLLHVFQFPGVHSIIFWRIWITSWVSGFASNTRSVRHRVFNRRTRFRLHSLPRVAADGQEYFWFDADHFRI